MKWQLFWVKQKRYSETSKVRHHLAKYCVGDGLDIGFGGDPIIPQAICVDLPNPYAKYRDHPQHLHGDGRDLKWFIDGCLDYVYSSHLLEDFEDTAAVLKEWLRVLKPDGKLVLFLPDEQVYRKDCQARGTAHSPHHIHEYFSLDYIKKIINENRFNVEIEHESFPVAIYSFELVLRKIK